MSLDRAEVSMDVAHGPVDARVAVPGSKSISNRALICAGLADGESLVRNAAPGADTQAMLECLHAFGVDIDLVMSDVRIRGLGGAPRGGCVLDARLAGTTSRFVTALAALGERATTISGAAPLLRRPMSDLHRALLELGASVEHLGESGHLPVSVHRGDLSGGVIRMKGDVSSQFLSSLMLIAPYLTGGLRVDLTSPLVSRPYVEMTARVMASFGVEGVGIGADRVTVPEGRYIACEYEIEPDASSASYPLAAAAITGGRVVIEDLGHVTLQGDVRMLELLADTGCTVSRTDGDCEVIGPAVLRSLDIDMADISDLVPTVAVLALFSDGATRIRNVAFIRGKESDRIGDLVAGIRLIGGVAEETPDGLLVQPLAGAPSTPIRVPTHHDHRLAMAWSLVALRRPGMSIADPSVVEKSWPDWWNVREAIRSSSMR